jgi:hypothetical protein
MLYFSKLPKILTPDQNGNSIVLTNLLARATLLEEFQNNPMLFYQYAIQDGDTPEIIAEKYYDDPYRYWIVLHSNNILDPLWEWPLPYEEFLEYINSKYSVQAAEESLLPFEYTNTTAYAYQKITKTTNLDTSTENIIYSNLTLDDYNSLQLTDETYNIGGYNCRIEVSKRIVTIFDHEYEINENRRIIKLLKSSYVGRFEQIFASLMET